MTDCPEGTQPMAAPSPAAAPRFIQLKDVAEVLAISTTQAYALLRTGELAAIKVGGRGQWRIEVSVLEDFIQRMYAETKTFVAAHPFGASIEPSRTDLVVRSVMDGSHPNNNA